MKPRPDPRASARLREARLRAGYRNAALFARDAGINPVTYRAHENGQRGLPVAAARDYAKRLRCSLTWLLTGEGTPEGSQPVPMIGYVGAGHQIHPTDIVSGEGIDTVEGPPLAGDSETTVAVEVQGESMAPVYRDGDLIFYSREPYRDIDAMIGRECVVRLAEGATLVKTIQRSGLPGRYNLTSYNEQTIEDVAVVWAAPVLWVKRNQKA